MTAKRAGSSDIVNIDYAVYTNGFDGGNHAVDRNQSNQTILGFDRNSSSLVR